MHVDADRKIVSILLYISETLDNDSHKNNGSIYLRIKDENFFNIISLFMNLLFKKQNLQFYAVIIQWTVIFSIVRIFTEYCFGWT